MVSPLVLFRDEICQSRSSYFMINFCLWKAKLLHNATLLQTNLEISLGNYWVRIHYSLYKHGSMAMPLCSSSIFCMLMVKSNSRCVVLWHQIQSAVIGFVKVKLYQQFCYFITIVIVVFSSGQLV